MTEMYSVLLPHDQDLTLEDLPSCEGSGEVQIHPSAIVEKGAQLGKGVVVGPFCYVGAKAIVHDWVRLDSHVSITNRTTVGRRCAVGSFSTLGVIPQDLKYRLEDAELIIGEENSIRQYVNLSIGTEGGEGRTVIGRRNLFMVYSHIAHDCVIGDNCVFANAFSAAGHVHIDSHSVMGGHSGVHQFCRIGAYVMVAGGSMVVQDVPPFVMVHGDRASVSGLNLVGLKRAGYSPEEIKDIKNMYRLLYNEKLTVEDAMVRLEADIPAGPSREMFLKFLRSSERGVCR